MAKTKVNVFAIIIGNEKIKIPYISHINIPIEKIKYICKDILRVCLSFITFTTCGINDIVVKNAAKYPIISIIVIINSMILKKIKIKKITLIISTFFIIVDLCAVILYNYYTLNYVNSRNCNNADVAVVFFADFDKEFNIDTLQKSRLNKSIELFNSRKVSHIICVGGNRQNQKLYGSAKSKEYLISKGIQSEYIFHDSLSFDTKTNLVQAHSLAKSNNLRKLIFVSDHIHLHRISLFDKNNSCLQDIDYQFSLIEKFTMANQTFLSFILEKILSEEDYLAFIQKFRN